MTSHTDTTDETPRARWEHATSIPLTIAALAFLAAYAWPILDPSIKGGTTQVVVDLTLATTWVLFVVDYAVRFALSAHRGRFVRGNLFDLGAVLLPILRPLRLLRLVTVLGVLNRHARGTFRGRVVVYVTGAAALVVFVASLAALESERGHEGANIQSFGDSIWWAFTTVTTVGYGDHFPVTLRGRAVAVGLMLGGIALIGVITASFASWLIDKVAEVEEESRAATRRDLRALSAEIAELRAALNSGTGQDDGSIP